MKPITSLFDLGRDGEQLVPTHTLSQAFTSWKVLSKKLFSFFLFGSNTLKSLQILLSFFILPCICHPLKTDAKSFLKRWSTPSWNERLWSNNNPFGLEVTWEHANHFHLCDPPIPITTPLTRTRGAVLYSSLIKLRSWLRIMLVHSWAETRKQTSLNCKSRNKDRKEMKRNTVSWRVWIANYCRFNFPWLQFCLFNKQNQNILKKEILGLHKVDSVELFWSV